MGKPVLVGDIGAGETTKLVNQVIVAINIAAVAEALIMGKKAGVDPKKIFEAIKGGLALFYEKMNKISLKSPKKK